MVNRATLLYFVWLIAVLSSFGARSAHALEALGTGMESYGYPHPVRQLQLRMEGESVRLAYMDIVAPGRTQDAPTAVLLHGRNFFGAYWADTIDALQRTGYRVIVPDQVGFGKSSKPDVPHSLHVHARNLKQLLDELGVKNVDLIGHSLGGMMAVRFALDHPQRVRKLVLEAPIGLEDYRIEVPHATREELTQEHLQTTPEGFDRLFRAFVGKWEPRFQTYSDVQAGWLLGADAWRIGRTAAHTWTMAYEQPVVYELPHLRMPTLLVVGELDRAAIGRNRVPADVRARLGLMPQLARRAAAAMPDATLVLLPAVGHVPHLEVPERFHRELLDFLER